MTNQRRNPFEVNSAKLIRYVVIGFILFFLFTLVTSSTFLTIDPGQNGVLFKRFSGGLDKEKIYDQGFHVVAPWNKMFIYDVRTNEAFETMEVLSKNGLKL